MSEDFLRLKWGTFKAGCFLNSPKAEEAFKKYYELDYGKEGSEEEKKLVCEMIDGVNGSVTIWWDEQDCTNDRQKAKDYVMNYPHIK